VKSRIHLKYKTKYHVGNWAEYDRALVDRGDVTFWLIPRAIATWSAVGVGKRRGQLQYSDLAIETALTVRLVFRLPLRQTEGFLASIFGMMGVDLAAPDHTTLSRRGQHLRVTLRPVPAQGGLHLIVDSTGLYIMGEGEWAAVKHGGNGRRGWKKLHLGVDETGVIVARALTEPTADDAITGISLVEHVDRDLTRVTADPAYDTLGFYDAAAAPRPVRLAHRPAARFVRHLAVSEREHRARSRVPGGTRADGGHEWSRGPALCPTMRRAKLVGPSPRCGTSPPTRRATWRTGAATTGAANETRGCHWYGLVALIGACGFVVTISSISDRESRKYFTELEGDRSDLRQDVADLGASTPKSANSFEKWYARQDSNLRPSA